MQVGTSCASTVSRGIDYTFTWFSGVESLRWCWAGPGPACYEASWLHPGISPLSRYGDWRLANLTLGITRETPARFREGSTDLSRCAGQDHSCPGQCYLPDKELRYLRTVIVTAAVYRGFGCELRLAANPLP